MRARDYNPTSGRFTATDAVQVPTGMPYVAGYSYAFNNPFMFTDANGLKPLGQYDSPITAYPLYEPVVTHGAAVFSWNGYQDTTTVNYQVIPSSVKCARDLDGTMGAITDICAARQTQAAIDDLRKRGGCFNNFLAWGAEHSGAITATFGVVALGGVSIFAGKANATKPGTAAPRPVGKYLESIDDVMANPKLLAGKTPAQVEATIGQSPGWRVETLGKGSHAGQGWVLRQYNEVGHPTGPQIRWHPGGGHHGPDPYWRVVGPNGDLGGVIQ
jgi:hypothetical protein